MHPANEADRVATALRATYVRFLEAFRNLDPGALASLKSPGCMHVFLPQSIGRRAMSIQEHAEYIRTLKGVLEDFQVEELETMVDPRARAVCAHVLATAESVHGAFSNEAVFWLRMSEDGARVVRVTEFADSATTSAYFGRLRRGSIASKV
ncbi:uncharacterized protein UV8b_07172 [Ustilaginoidea virens]|uniref:SnoaL-like domain-containing protein n=1 Tax=Ustilaginoidea virens TaxID=1159556 RepID=A0A063BMJ3_USTVR|nr:uncharacterized protein UV8b_07172 [Ustilaginoidea virens]QUC22931.1 hypothetical protein UV8b_07172 [Ustilaginoidea virens]GAO17572.1 hypothetical protein UVI_02047390 [Ustilaginoidea virens]